MISRRRLAETKVTDIRGLSAALIRFDLDGTRLGHIPATVFLVFCNGPYCKLGHLFYGQLARSSFGLMGT